MLKRPPGACHGAEPVPVLIGSSLVPKRNYGFEKRQKELKRQLKKEEKKQRKLDRAKEPEATASDQPESPAVEDRP